MSRLNDLELLGFEKWTNDWARFLLSLTGLRILAIGHFARELDYFPWWPTPPLDAAATATAEINEEEEEDKDDDVITRHQHPLQHPLFSSLESLSLWGWEKVESLPEQLQHLTALKELTLCYFDGLESLSEWLGNLSSLQSLQIFCAQKLMNLPTAEAMRRLTSLRSLVIDFCPLLKERCKKEIGPEWHKIAHIPSILIDLREIQPRHQSRAN